MYCKGLGDASHCGCWNVSTAALCHALQRYGPAQAQQSSGYYTYLVTNTHYCSIFQSKVSVIGSLLLGLKGPEEKKKNQNNCLGIGRPGLKHWGVGEK